MENLDTDLEIFAMDDDLKEFLKALEDLQNTVAERMIARGDGHYLMDAPFYKGYKGTEN